MLTASCGRIHYEPRELVDVGPRPDANVPRCAWEGVVTFGAPRLVARPAAEGNTVVNPAIDPSGLRLTYVVDGVARAMTRPSTMVEFSGAADFADFAPERGQLGSWTTRRDGLEQYLALGDPTMTGTFNLVRRTRMSTSSRWSSAAPLTFGQEALADDWDPFMSADGLTLWFQVQRGNVGDFYRATRTSTALPFNTASAFPTSFDTEGNPSVPDDDTALVFSAQGALYYWPLNAGVPQGAPIALPELDGASTDYEASVRADGCEIVWVRQMGARQEILRATRLPTGA